MCMNVSTVKEEREKEKVTILHNEAKGRAKYTKNTPRHSNTKKEKTKTIHVNRHGNT